MAFYASYRMYFCLIEVYAIPENSSAETHPLHHLRLVDIKIDFSTSPALLSGFFSVVLSGPTCKLFTGEVLCDALILWKIDFFGMLSFQTKRSRSVVIFFPSLQVGKKV